jgi:hypothetical protein
MKFIEPITPTLTVTNAKEETPQFFNFNFEDGVTINAIKRCNDGNYYAGGKRVKDSVQTAVLYYSSDAVNWFEVIGIELLVGNEILRLDATSNFLVLGLPKGLVYRTLNRPPFSLSYQVVPGSEDYAWFEFLEVGDTLVCRGAYSNTLVACMMEGGEISDVVTLATSVDLESGLTNMSWCPGQWQVVFFFKTTGGGKRVIFLIIPYSVSDFSSGWVTIYSSAFVQTPKSIGVISYWDGGEEKDLIFMNTEESEGTRELRYSLNFFATESIHTLPFQHTDMIFFNSIGRDHVDLFAINSGLNYIQFNSSSFSFSIVEIEHKKVPSFLFGRWNYISDSGEIYFASDISKFSPLNKRLNTSIYVVNELALFEQHKYRALKRTVAIPKNDGENWELVGYDNTDAFQFSSYTAQTLREDSLDISLTYSKSFNRMSLMNVTANSVSVWLGGVLLGTITGSSTGSWYKWHINSNTTKDLYLMFDTQATGGVIDLAFSGTGDVGVGYVVCGMEVELGQTELGSGMIFKDYSRKEEDGNGNFFLQQRAFARTGDFSLQINREELNNAFTKVGRMRAIPTAWFAGDYLETDTRIYGFISDFSIIFENPKTISASLMINGMS